MLRTFLVCFLAIILGASAASISAPLNFTGMCDASAGVALADGAFAVANDEDNLLRFYRLDQPGKPVFSFDLTPLLFGKRKSGEADLEGAARIGDRIFWITSHGRNAKGKDAPTRQKLFALEIHQRDTAYSVELIGRPYTTLLTDLSREPKLQRFDLAGAAKLPPKAVGGLNIEALTDTPEGTLLIGFRNPVPNGQALLVPLLNPNDILEGRLAKFGDPILLDLGGLGLRGIGSTGTGYYLMAGPISGDGECRLFSWNGTATKPRLMDGLKFPGINPEGICFHDRSTNPEFLVLSDDGTRQLEGRDCKSLPENQRQFRAFRLLP